MGPFVIPYTSLPCIIFALWRAPPIHRSGFHRRLGHCRSVGPAARPRTPNPPPGGPRTRRLRCTDSAPNRYTYDAWSWGPRGSGFGVSGRRAGGFGRRISKYLEHPKYLGVPGPAGPRRGPRMLFPASSLLPPHLLIPSPSLSSLPPPPSSVGPRPSYVRCRCALVSVPLCFSRGPRFAAFPLLEQALVASPSNY